MAKKSSGQQLLEELPAVETPTGTPKVPPVNDPPVETPVAETPPENTQNALDIPQVVSRETNRPVSLQVLVASVVAANFHSATATTPKTNKKSPTNCLQSMGPRGDSGIAV